MHHVLVVLCGPLQAGQFASRLVQGRHHVLEGAAVCIDPCGSGDLSRCRHHATPLHMECSANMGTTRAKINLAPTGPLTVSKDCALYHNWYNSTAPSPSAEEGETL